MYYRLETGDIYKLDFDNKERGISADFSQPPTKKKNIESDDKLKETDSHEDLTPEQYEENYWVQTDASTNMMEARISKYMEAYGVSREKASKEVKARMKKQGSEETNTDMKEDVTDKEIEEEDEEEEVKDTVDICPKKLAILKEKAKQFDILTEEKAVLEADLDSFKKDFAELKKDYDDKKAADIEAKRQEIIERISHDFVIAKENLQEKTLDQLEDYEGILDIAMKRDTGGKDPEEYTEDFQKTLDIMEQKSKELDERYHQKL